VEEIAALAAEQARDPGKRPAQRRLAEEMTTRIHGEQALRNVLDATRVLFGGAELRSVNADVLALLSQEIPSVRLPGAEVVGLPVPDALVRTGLASSKSDARRGIAGKGFLVNGETVAAPERTLAAGDLLHGRFVLLQKGKRNHALLVAEG
jgi:tyrosyl-tRNA synthetase